jgi:Flp pilus assembly protein TadG
MLLMPVFAILILGAAHFGGVLTTRHKLSDATSYATRAAVVRRVSDAPGIQAMLVERLGAPNRCATVGVVASLITDGTGLTRLQVTATCTLQPPLGSSLLGAIGPASVSSTVAMPY